MTFWPAVKKAIRESDVILLVVDARLPALSTNRELLEKVEYAGKKMFIVYNKTDLLSKEQLEKIKRGSEASFFISAPTGAGIKHMRHTLEEFAERNNISTLKVGMVGYPNVGKSSLINAITKTGRAQVSNLAGTTKGIQWIKVGRLKFLDSPGVIPFEDKSRKLGLIGAKNPEKLQDPYGLAIDLLRKFLRADKPALEKYYGLEFTNDVESAFEAIGRKRGFLSRGGIVDETKTAVSIIRDWQRGKIKIYE